MALRSFAVSRAIAVLASIAVGIELHAGHQATHATALWRRLGNHRSLRFHRSGRHTDAGKDIQVEIGVHTERVKNITTELQDQKTEYIGMIGVGTAHDGDALFNARVVFDTGSTNLWVASVLCTQAPCDCPRAKEYYDPKKSLTAEDYRGLDAGDDIDIQFGTGELVGPLHTDSYIVGPMRVRQQTFAMIRTMTGDVFSSFPFEGILGLGFPSLSFGGIEPFFERVINQQLLEHNEFAFYLSRENPAANALLWGGVDKAFFEGKVRYFPVRDPHYWSVELISFKIGDHTLLGQNLTDPKLTEGQKQMRQVSHTAVLDSGTTFLAAPSSIFTEVMERLPPARCDSMTQTTHPPLVFTFKTNTGELHDYKVENSGFMSKSGDWCTTGFMNINLPKKHGPGVVLGDSFLREYFSIFDRGDGNEKNARVGLARAAPTAKAAARLNTLTAKQPSLLEGVRSHHDMYNGVQGWAIDTPVDVDNTVVAQTITLDS